MIIHREPYILHLSFLLCIEQFLNFLWWWVRPILVFRLSLDQAGQYFVEENDMREGQDDTNISGGLQTFSPLNYPAVMK